MEGAALGQGLAAILRWTALIASRDGLSMSFVIALVRRKRTDLRRRLRLVDCRLGIPSEGSDKSLSPKRPCSMTSQCRPHQRVPVILPRQHPPLVAPPFWLRSPRGGYNPSL